RARAPVAGSGVWPAWIWRVSKDQLLLMGVSSVGGGRCASPARGFGAGWVRTIRRAGLGRGAPRGSENPPEGKPSVRWGQRHIRQVNMTTTLGAGSETPNKVSAS